MKSKAVFVLILMMVWASASIAQSDNQKSQNSSSGKVDVYYFHNERRCATCMAVEEESKKSLDELYPDKMKSGDMTFLSVNIEDEVNQPLVEKFKISGQTLLIVKGDKQEDLTNTAFLYATTNPDKLKKAISKTIENL